MENIVGAQPYIATVCVGPHDNLDERRTAVACAIAAADNGEGVIVIAALFGATPCNLAVSLAGRPDVDVISGVNLPMLVEIARATQSGKEATRRAARERAACGLRGRAGSGRPLPVPSAVAATRPPAHAFGALSDRA